MYGKYQFPCGCSFDIIEEATPKGCIPLLNFDIKKIPQDCPAVWDLLAQGITKGVFQLESSLGRQWTKKLKPNCVDHLAALGALLRPGCLRATDEEGVSMTEHYCRRKNGLEPVTEYHPALKDILGKTYQVLTYQEQFMRIAKELAGFDLKQVDRLRKAAGKKLASEMSEVGKLFLEGCAKVGILNNDQAEMVWSWIVKSARYSFNCAHSMAYGLIGYDTAYLKAHFPLAFYCGWLRYAHKKPEPQEEIRELVSEAKLLDVEVEPPDLLTLKPHFHTDRKVIKFGLTSVKGVGEIQVEKIMTAAKKAQEELNKPLGAFSWYDFLLYMSDGITSLTCSHLIEAGALRFTGMDRLLMKAEFDVWDYLTDKEKEWFKKNYQKEEKFVDLLKKGAKIKKQGGAAANKNRVAGIISRASLLENPPSPLRDSPNWISVIEEDLFGISLTYSKLDSCDLSAVNCTCKEFLQGREGYLLLGVQIRSAREWTTKKGKKAGAKMAFLSVGDNSGDIEDVVVFSDVWKESKDILREKNLVVIHGEKDKERGSLIVKKVWELKKG